MFCNDMCLFFNVTLTRREKEVQFEWVGWEGNVLQANRPDIPMGYVNLIIN